MPPSIFLASVHQGLLFSLSSSSSLKSSSFANYYSHHRRAHKKPERERESCDDDDDDEREREILIGETLFNNERLFLRNALFFCPRGASALNF